MIELISLVGGGLFRLAPSVVEWFSKRQDHAHELAMIDRQMDLERLKWQQKEAEIAAQAEASESGKWADALAPAMQPVKSGVKWVDAVNASVRPALTYWWCLCLYSTAKGIIVYSAIESGAGLPELSSIVLDEFDRAVVGSIIGFWFLDRALRKMSK